MKDILPKEYGGFDNRLLFEILRIFNSIPFDSDNDVFGRIYEYFLGKFAMSEGQGGGEFYTPESLVKLIVNIIEPYHGRIYDPACGSGGMFVQSARFVGEHQKNAAEEISIYGQEYKESTMRLCKLNLAVHGLSGDIRLGNTYYEDPHDSVGKFDYVIANPPFNDKKWGANQLSEDIRFKYGVPSDENANFVFVRVLCLSNKKLLTLPRHTSSCMP